MMAVVIAVSYAFMVLCNAANAIAHEGILKYLEDNYFGRTGGTVRTNELLHHPTIRNVLEI